jgi:ATP-dependent DNA helicase DinG
MRARAGARPERREDAPGRSHARSLGDEWFGPDGRLARSLPQFEHRSGQQQMARAVLDALDRRRHLIVEAGTGTGKTLAYLIPAVLSGERVVVSTATKTLQDQLLHKDVPLLEERLGLRASACALKGRDNYLCRLRLRDAVSRPGLDPSSAAALRLVADWSRETPTGDRGEIADLPEDVSLWPQISAKADTCLGTRCPDYADCFLTRARQHAFESRLVIVNHHLYFADLALREHAFGQILPDHRIAIFDEAHEMEEIAQQYFGRSVSTFRLRELTGDLERLGGRDPAVREAARGRGAKIAAAARELLGRFAGAGARFRIVAPGGAARSAGRGGAGGQGRDVRAAGRISAEPAWAEDLLDRLADLGERLRSLPERSEEAEALARRAGEIGADLAFILSGADPTHVCWGEERSGGFILRATRVDVAGPLADLLFAQRDTVILTSATLSIGGSFEFVRRSLGIAEADEAIIASPFDYPSQAILYTPRRMPEPRAPGHLDRLQEEILSLLDISRGRAFLLFTSYATLEATRLRLAAAALPYPLLCQGDEPKNALLERFRSTPGAVLLGTTSFWQGVDVPGEALSLVVIDKLPFDVPTDPLVEARLERIEKSGGSSFRDYSLPAAVIMLKQGLGRLIRSRTDHGVLAVLDPRLRTRSYGRTFLASLPDFGVTDRLDAVAAFFKAGA